MLRKCENIPFPGRKSKRGHPHRKQVRAVNLKTLQMYRMFTVQYTADRKKTGGRRYKTISRNLFDTNPQILARPRI
jgi:hypothetical protein